MDNFFNVKLNADSEINHNIGIKSSSVPLSKISQESLDNVLKKFGIKI